MHYSSTEPQLSGFDVAKGLADTLQSPDPLPVRAAAYRLGNLLSLPKAGKWRGCAFAGMVVPRAALEYPGVEIERLLKLNAIFPATLAELADYERAYGNPDQVVKNRERQFTELRNELRRRLRGARKDSARAKLLSDFIGEWSDVENQCRMRWSGEFGLLMGKSQEQVRRYWIDKESDLRTLGGKEDIYREQIEKLAEPLLIAAAGLSIDITPLHDFLASMSHQWNGLNPKEREAQAWLQPLRYKLLHGEKKNLPIYLRIAAAFWRQGWKIFIAALTAVTVLVATAAAVHFFRSRGINLQ
jgi:hypothetical protein